MGDRDEREQGPSNSDGAHDRDRPTVGMPGSQSIGKRSNEPG